MSSTNCKRFLVAKCVVLIKHRYIICQSNKVNKMKYHIGVCMFLAALHATSAVDYSTYPEVTRFREYVQINTTTGGDLEPAVIFWKKLAAAQNVSISVVELVEGCPIVILSWPGNDPTLSSVMLNSHMDVVPAVESDGWTYPPFSGQITSDGNIWGRGTQDMKSVAIQYYEAMSRLKAKGVTLERNVYMTLMPDEEVGAECGMIPFLQSKEFASLNVGVEFDEGTPYPVPFIPLFYQDKVVWQIQVDCYGVAAHGSTFPPTNATATGKCQNVINTLLKFRDEQYEIYTTAPETDAGVYTSINLNKINAGTANNVIPSHMSAVFDIRLGTKVNETSFAKQLSDWIETSDGNVTITYLLKNQQSPATLIGDSNPYWVAIAQAAQDLGITVVPLVPPGSTDARFVRLARIPAFGFSPMPMTELLLHAVNEHLSLETFLNGIDIYEGIIPAVANLSLSDVGAEPSVYVYDTNSS
ncbi:aminoacylase-1-like [Epargyreus clarus]|uniref:aminoacylase-1-like n=1 Tax=Epargyreus clarus TaxID=520877 RepID=UPI003C2D5802